MQTQLLARQGKEVELQTVVGETVRVTVKQAADTEVVTVLYQDGHEGVVAYKHIIRVRYPREPEPGQS